MQTTVLHPWHGVAYGENAPRIVNAIIEIPQGSRCKYEIDKASGLLKLDRIIYSSFHYPVNYGFIPQTYGDDKDPLDILVISSLSVALPLFRKGHIPVIGEWFALPLIKLAGSTKPGDDAWNEIQYPIAHRILAKCDAVLRLEGESKGADEDVRVAKERGLPIFFQLEDVPDEK